MRGFASFVLTAVAGIGLAVSSMPKAQAQIGVSIGVAPECPYGYYDVAPYNCAAAGYYGPEWFYDGAFIGAGPWFHGHENFRGYVDNRFHPEHGYRGELPRRGEKAEPARRVDHQHFNGNEMRDGRGHAERRN
jgi:hypothetical protein